jgi:hypothetical protein
LSDLVPQTGTEMVCKVAIFELLTCWPEVQKSSRIEVAHVSSSGAKPPVLPHLSVDELAQAAGGCRVGSGELRRVGIVVSIACVRNGCQASNMKARRASKPHMLEYTRHVLDKSCELYLAMLLMSLSESPVVASIVTIAFFMRLLAC